MKMNDIIITKIDEPIIVQSEQGCFFQMKNRTLYGISFCISGQITYYMDGKTIISDPDHVVFLPKGKSYTLYRDKKGLFPLINFDCNNFNCDTITSLKLCNPAQCLADYEKIKNMFHFKENNLKILSHFYELLSNVYTQQLPQKSIVTPIVDFIEKNISDPTLSNNILAKQLNISEVYLRNLFLKDYKVTPKQFILDMRLKKAKNLLTYHNRSITSISEECGFSSVYHFCRTFKHKLGITPSEYSKQNLHTEI